jgi:hypothetical protein
MHTALSKNSRRVDPLDYLQHLQNRLSKSRAQTPARTRPRQPFPPAPGKRDPRQTAKTDKKSSGGQPGRDSLGQDLGAIANSGPFRQLSRLLESIQAELVEAEEGLRKDIADLNLEISREEIRLSGLR